MRRTAHKRRRGESGSALIPVLALILACSMIVTAVIAMSQLNVYTMTAHVKQQKSMYLCEGAANRIQWLVAAERNLNPNVSYDTFDYADYEYDRFLPDGVEHEMDYHGTPVKFRITDAAAGLDFSRTLRLNTLNRLKMNTATDAEFTDTMTTLDNQLRDYTDADDVVTDDGREESEFQLLGQLPLPRNAEFQYREELFFIPEFTALRYPHDTPRKPPPDHGHDHRSAERRTTSRLRDATAATAATAYADHESVCNTAQSLRCAGSLFEQCIRSGGIPTV